MPQLHQPLEEGEAAWSHRLPRPGRVTNRLGWLAEQCKGRSVAHLGFADAGCERSRALDGSWVHAALGEQAKHLVGLDVARSGVAAAREAGYEVHEVDCTNPEEVRALDLGEFDLVVAGELIEHVANPAGLLEVAAVLAGPHGELIVSTPNARRLVDTFTAAIGLEIVHPDHVAIYSARTLIALLARYGWRVDHIYVCSNPPSTDPAGGWRDSIMHLSLGVQRAAVRTVAPYLADGLIVRASRA